MRIALKKLLKVSVLSSVIAASTLSLSQGSSIPFVKQIEGEDPLLSLAKELAPYFTVDGTDFEKSPDPAQAIKEFLEKGGKLAVLFDAGTDTELLFVFEKDKVTLSDGKTKETYTIGGEFVSSEEI